MSELRSAFKRYRAGKRDKGEVIPMAEDEVVDALRDIKYNKSVPLTLWEETFVAGMERAVELKIPFSPKRQERLRVILKERTNKK